MSIFHRKRSLLQSQKLLRRERERQWAKIIFVCILLGGLLWGMSALSFAQKINVQNILVSGNSAVPTDEVMAIAKSELRGRDFWIFSRANIFWYPKTAIENDLKYTFSWIDEVLIKRVDLTTIEIKIKERVPVAVWCGLSPEKSLPCQLVDADGNLFAKAPEFAGAAYLKLYGPLTSASWRGAGFFSKTGLAHILDFAKNLPEIGFQPLVAAVIGPNEYNVVMDGGSYISARTSDPVSGIVSNLDSLLTEKQFALSQAKNFSNLVYIDARFGNKLFYKFKSATSTKM